VRELLYAFGFFTFAAGFLLAWIINNPPRFK
jgi:membrane protein insertase Oxa1/YidC/SpoIIIJ